MRRTHQNNTPRRGGPFQSWGGQKSTQGHLSMQDEAKHTLISHSAFDNGDLRLRSRPVQFTASKPLIPSEDLPLPETTILPPKSDDQKGKSPEEEVAINSRANEQLQATEPTPPSETKAEVKDTPEEETHSNGKPSFFVDLDGNKGSNGQSDTPPGRFTGEFVVHKVTTRNVKIKASEEQPAAADSSSDGEVILFKGRAKHQPPARQIHTYTIRHLEQKLVDVAISNDQTEEESRNDSEAAMDDYAQNARAGNSDGDQDTTDLLMNSAFSRRAIGGQHDDIDMGEMSHDSTGALRGGTNHIIDRAARQTMDDEHLARLLAKQDELGLGGNDLELFDDQYDEAPPVKVPNSSKAKGLSERNLMKSRKLKAPRPSASEIADAFDDFDVMDWSRTSLQKKNKNVLPAAPSDSELEQRMQSTYQKDRLKKAAKKQAREELRAQGQLRKNVNPQEPRVAYQTGMNLEDIKKEFVAFLVNEDENLIFPPMDANARKILHEISTKLNIKSKSAGQGDQRHTTLRRTKFTAKYSAASVDAVFARAGRKHFPRMDKKGTYVNSGAGRGAGAAATVRDGDVVGGGAAELGVSNRGRTMLEKMGWSSGMALGIDNQGITQPIEHIVKKSKAGLG